MNTHNSQCRRHPAPFRPGDQFQIDEAHFDVALTRDAMARLVACPMLRVTIDRHSGAIIHAQVECGKASATSTPDAP